MLMILVTIPASPLSLFPLFCLLLLVLREGYNCGSHLASGKAGVECEPAAETRRLILQAPLRAPWRSILSGRNPRDTRFTNRQPTRGDLFLSLSLPLPLPLSLSLSLSLSLPLSLSLSLSLSLFSRDRTGDRTGSRRDRDQASRTVAGLRRRHRCSPKGNQRGREREREKERGRFTGWRESRSYRQRYKRPAEARIERIRARGEDMQLGRRARGERERYTHTHTHTHKRARCVVRNGDGNKFARQTSPSCRVVYLSIACLPRKRERESRLKMEVNDTTRKLPRLQ